ncbi:MAG: hypothetical protein R3E42_20005 [Burkholderiaceae bacterium]
MTESVASAAGSPEVTELEAPWLKRCVHAVAHSIKLRLVVVFLLLAVAMTGVFVVGAQRAFTVGWKEAARPLMMDYVDHLARDITGGGPAPRIDRAKALVQRLPITIYIYGPNLDWESHPGNSIPYWLRDRVGIMRHTCGRVTGAKAPIGRPFSGAPPPTATPSSLASMRPLSSAAPGTLASPLVSCFC